MTINVTLVPVTLQVRRDKPHARAEAVFFGQVGPDAPIWFNAVLRRAIVQAKDGWFILATINEIKEVRNDVWSRHFNMEPDFDLVVSWTEPSIAGAPTVPWDEAVAYLTNVLPTAASPRKEEEPLP